MSFEAKIGDKIYPVSIADLDQLDLIQSGQTIYHGIYKERSVKIEILELDVNQSKCILRIDNEIHNISILDDLAQIISQLGFNAISSQSDKTVKAPMPGLVLSVDVKPGDIVKPGDKLLILEAMKMENIIKSSATGTIKTVHCKAGTSVDKAQILIEIE